MKASLLLVFLASAAAFAPGLSARPLSHQARTIARTPAPYALLDLFGNGKKKPKKEEGALTQGLDAMLANAPLPVKMAATLVKPLVGALEGAIRESAADADELYDEARRRLMLDNRVSGLALGRVFSQMSSSSSVNGMTSKMMDLQCELTNDAGYPAGSARIRGEAVSGSVKLSAMQVQLSDGRVLDIGGGGSSGASGGSSDGVIDVEVL